MTSQLITHPLKQPTFAANRPAGKTADTPIGQFRQDIRDVGAKNNDFVLKPANQDAPPTRISKGLSSLKRGGLVLLGMLGSLGIGYGGVQALKGYVASQPSAETVKQDELIKPDFDKLVSIAEAARKTGGTQDPALQGKFYEQFHMLMIRMMKTMGDYPGGQLDKTLVEQMERNTDFMPSKNAYTIAFDFTEFMEKELKKQNTTPAKAAKFQIESINIREGFVNRVSDFQSLNSSQKDALTKELQARYIKEQAFPSPGYFTETVKGALGSGVEGLTLAQFAHIQTKDDAKALVRTAVMNSKNYQQFTPAQREAMANRLGELLDSVNHYSPPFVWALGAFAALAVGFGAAGFLGVTRWRDMVEAATSAPADISKGLRHPTLVINHADLGNPDAERQLSLMVNTIQYQAGEMARVMQESYTANPELRQLLAKTYPDAASLPDADYFINKYIHVAKTEIMKGRTFTEKLAEKPVDELTFTQLVLNRMQDAFEKGNYAPLELPEGMLTPEKLDVNQATNNPVEALQQERRRIEHHLRTAMTLLANQTFALYKDTDALNKLMDGVKVDLTRYNEQKDTMPAAERSVLEMSLASRKDDIQRARSVRPTPRRFCPPPSSPSARPSVRCCKFKAN